MMDGNSRTWLKPTILLCTYGFFTYIKPSEPYVTPFLMGPHKNLTEDEVVNQIFPVWSYSYTAFLVPIFLLTDYLKYKPIIVLQGLGYIGCWILLVFSKGVPLMQLMQVFYGLATACEIGYYAYIYSVVDNDYYQKATSYVRTATQMGLFLGSTLSQILVSVAHVDYIYLNVISLIDVSIGFLISFFLPSPKRTLYFYHGVSKEAVDHPENVSENTQDVPSAAGNEEDPVEENPSDLSNSPNWRQVLLQLWLDLKQCYSSPSLLRWSAWWALSTCGWILVVNYIQNLWETIQSSQENESEVYNGAVEAAAQIFGAGAAFSVGYLKIDWSKWGEFFLGFGSIIKCGLLFVMYFTDNIWICYTAYVFFISLYNFIITISQFRIAVGLSTERFALVFGMNTFFAVVLNSILTLILIDDAGFGLNVETQFAIYSIYFGLIAFLYLGHAVFALIKRRRNAGLEEEIIGENEEQVVEEDHL